MTNFSRKREGLRDNAFNPKPKRRKMEEGQEERKKEGYKAKRSFSKNKDFRKKKVTKEFDSFSEPKRNAPPFKRNFKRQKPTYKGNEDSVKAHYEPKKEGSLPNKHKKQRFDKRGEKKRVNFSDLAEGKTFTGPKKETQDRYKKQTTFNSPVTKNESNTIRLNKYLSNAGIASRREADNLILSGVVKVNDVVITQLGYKINIGDKVTYGDQNVKGEKKVYLLLNKPKDYITTLDDPQARKTVMELIKGACRERVYPVGRLDRNTTGLLLFTNDGELTTKLTHPKFGVKKVYHVSLNKGLKTEDFSKIMEGLELEDGMVKADELAYIGEGKKEIGIEIHSGRNRIVRRLFEHLGYDVIKLDRVTFAGLTKKDLPRGKYRFLTAKEISFLKMVG